MDAFAFRCGYRSGSLTPLALVAVPCGALNSGGVKILEGRGPASPFLSTPRVYLRRMIALRRIFTLRPVSLLILLWDMP